MSRALCEDVTFPARGEKVAAWLYRPEGAGPHPVVVLAHGLGGQRIHRLDVFAEHFATCGIAALAFDYRHFGESDEEPRQLVSVRRQLQDWRAALTFVRTHPDLDRERVAVWETSLSAGHVQTIAAQDPSIRAAVAQAPFVDGFLAGASVGWRQVLRLGFAASLDIFRVLLRRPPVRIRIFGEPGTLAAMTAPGAAEAIRRTMIPPGDWDETMPARTFATLPLYRPGRHAAHIECPIFYLIAEGDRITPAKAALAAAARAPRSEVLCLPIDHFDIYSGFPFHQAVAAETRFLTQHLLIEQPSARTREPSYQSGADVS